jgi:hypothetical protein
LSSTAASTPSRATPTEMAKTCPGRRAAPSGRRRRSRSARYFRRTAAVRIKATD